MQYDKENYKKNCHDAKQYACLLNRLNLLNAKYICISYVLG